MVWDGTVWYGMGWDGMVWYGIQVHPQEDELNIVYRPAPTPGSPARGAGTGADGGAGGGAAAGTAAPSVLNLHIDARLGRPYTACTLLVYLNDVAPPVPSTRAHATHKDADTDTDTAPARARARAARAARAGLYGGGTVFPCANQPPDRVRH